MLFSISATVVSKTKTMNRMPSAELELDPVIHGIGWRGSSLDLSRHITLTGPEAEAAELGDRYKITLEKIA